MERASLASGDGERVGCGRSCAATLGTGEVEPPPGIWRELPGAVEARQAQLEHIRDELARHPSLTDSGRPPAASDET